jgi:hypothetical protein
VLELELPVFTLFSAIYMPIIEGVMLLQFLRYNYDNSWVKWVPFCVFVAAVIVVRFTAPTAVPYLEWVAVALWSIEMYP